MVYNLAAAVGKHCVRRKGQQDKPKSSAHVSWRKSSSATKLREHKNPRGSDWKYLTLIAL
jgi:hypothetical protein